MSATDELRRMLDERGVEHADFESAPYPPYNSTRRMTTFWANKCVWQYIEDEREGGDIELEGRYMSTSVTPAQAIAVTLGSDDTFTREDVEGAFVSGYSLGLDMFDSSKPDNEKGWDQNKRNLDEEMEDLGWVRKDATALGAETCHLKPWEMERDTGFYDCMECDCGYVADVADWAEWSYCPNCGAKVVDA